MDARLTNLKPVDDVCAENSEKHYEGTHIAGNLNERLVALCVHCS